MKVLDFFIIAVCIILGLAGVTISLNAQAGDTVSVKTPYGNYEYPLKKDRIIEVKGLLGRYIIEIKNGQVHAKESNCPLKLCVQRGWIKNSGDGVVCIPNKIVIRIQSVRQKVDAVTE